MCYIVQDHSQSVSPAILNLPHSAQILAYGNLLYSTTAGRFHENSEAVYQAQVVHHHVTPEMSNITVCFLFK